MFGHRIIADSRLPGRGKRQQEHQQGRAKSAHELG